MTAPAPGRTADNARFGEEGEAAIYVLIKRGLYWRPNAMGYTGVLAEAGLYTEAEASARADGDGTTMQLAGEATEFAPACWQETKIAVLSQQVAQLRSDLAAARKERDEARGYANRNGNAARYWEWIHGEKDKRLARAQEEAASLRRQLQEAQKAGEAMRGALDQAEACLSIVEPRTDKTEYLRTLGVVRAALVARIPAVEQTAAWPAGCIKPNSCARHRQCMYAGSVEQCRHFGKDLTQAVEAALAPKAAPLPETGSENTGGPS